MKKVTKKRASQKASYSSSFKENTLKNLQIFYKNIAKKKKNYQKAFLKARSQFQVKVKWWQQYLQFWLLRESFLKPKKVQFYAQIYSLKYGFKAFSVVYFITLFLVVIFTNRIVSFSVSPELAQQLFIGSGAMIGGTLAIVVSFSLFTLQHSAEYLPKDFYRVAADIKKYLTIFLLDTAITIILILGAITYGRAQMGLSSFSVQGGVVLIGFSFYLLLLLLYYLREDTDPDKVRRKVTEKLISSIRKVHQRTERYAQILLLHPDNRGQASVNTLIAQLFQSSSSQQQWKYINDRVSYLFDYHDSLSAKHEKSAALEVLDDIKSVVLAYLEIRNKSSLAIPESNTIFVLTSDSKYVLQPILERMISLSESYMKMEDTSGVIKTVDVFIEWLIVSSRIEYIGLRRQENPIFGQIHGYFDQLMTRAITHNSLEGMFQGLRFYKNALNLGIDKGYHFELSSIYEKVEQIGYQSVKTRQEPVFSEAFEVYSFAIEKLVNSEYHNLEIELSSLLENLKNLTMYGYVMTARGTMRDNRIVQQDIAKPYKKLVEMIAYAVTKADSSSSADKKREWQHTTMLLVEENYSLIRRLPEVIKDPNYFLVLSLGDGIRDIGMILLNLSVDQNWNEHNRTILRELRGYIHLPSWFLGEDVKKIDDDQSFEALTEAVAEIGITGLEKGDDELAQEGIKILSKIATDLLSKEKGKGALYMEPATMELACYIGILALKLGKDNIVALIKGQIQIFDSKYKEVYFSDVPRGIDPYTISPPPDKLKRDIEDLIDERNSWQQMDRFGLKQSREKLFSLVVADDISNFVKTIWG